MEPRFRSRSLKRVKVRLPGGKTVLHFRKKKTGFKKCAECKSKLLGIARGRAIKLKKMPKAKKRVSRIYGGYLCAKCLGSKIKEKYFINSDKQ